MTQHNNESGFRVPPSGFRPPEWRPPGTWVHWLLVIVLAILLIATARSAFYTVGTDVEAVVLRLGRYTTTEGAGFHLKLPFGFDTVARFPTARVLKQEFGFRTTKADVRSEFVKGPYAVESLTLTGDLNIADVEWIVQYRITSATDYWFHLNDPDATVRDLSEAVLREVAGSRTVDDLLTVGRNQIEAEAQTLLQKSFNSYKAGIKVIAVQLRGVTPPEPVQASFNDVNRAEQDREKLINEAKATYNREIPKAEGQALQMVERAEGARRERVNRAMGDAGRFKDILAEYKKSPDVTRKRLYLETMAQVLPAIDEITVLDVSAKSGILPVLQLGSAVERLPEAPARGAP